MRYQTIDQCTDDGCRCLDTAGVILYDGDNLADAEAASAFARYPAPQIIVVPDATATGRSVAE